MLLFLGGVLPYLSGVLFLGLSRLLHCSRGLFQQVQHVLAWPLLCVAPG